MPKLDARLKSVAELIDGGTHVDVGSDHGGLLAALLASGRIDRGIAVENKPVPLENSRRALAGFGAAEVRLGDGLAAVEPGEADSLSICGIGGECMAGILAAHPQRLPDRLVLQPNHKPEWVRRWAIEHHFHLLEERVVWGHWPYQIVAYVRAADADADPAYAGVDHEAALLFGPLNLKRADAALVRRLREEHAYLSAMPRLEETSAVRLRAIDRYLGAR